MTWVVGGSSPFGYGVMVSDVRVSWDDGTEADLLRKAYRVGPYLLAGFAGSVNIGFQLIGDLQNFLSPPDNSASAWKPEWVADHWHPNAAGIFAQAPPDEQAGHSQLLIVGVSPDEHLGAPEFPRAYLIKLEAPDFRPTYLPKGLSVCHIGSGSDVAIYEKTIAEFFQLSSPTLQTVIAGPAAWAQMLGNSIGRLVSDNPTDGISPHVHIQVCSLGGFSAGNNDVTRVYSDGKRVNFRMPQVASTQAEFVALCKNIGKAPTRARAMTLTSSRARSAASWQAQWAIPARRADQGRDCGAAEIQRIAENARWPDMKTLRAIGWADIDAPFSLIAPGPLWRPRRAIDGTPEMPDVAPPAA